MNSMNSDEWMEKAMAQFIESQELEKERQRQQYEQRRAEFDARDRDKCTALKGKVKDIKASMRAAVNKAIDEGRIPGRPCDYSLSVLISRCRGFDDKIEVAMVRTRLIPVLDLRVMRFDDYPYMDELDALSKEIGYPVEGYGKAEAAA